MLGQSDTGRTWVENGAAEVSGQSIVYQYSTTLHWAFMQMGTGSTDVVPTNSNERCFGMFAVVLGTLFFSWFVSTLSTTFVTLGQMHAATDAQVRQLRKFLRQFRVSAKMSMLVERQAVDRLSLKKPLTVADVSALAVLSPSLRDDLQVELCKPYLLRHAVFRILQAFDQNPVREIMVGCIQFVVTADVLFTAGAQASRTYVLDYGKVDYIQLPEQSRVEVRTVKPMPTDVMVVEPAMWLHWTHVGTAVAHNMASLVSVDADKLSRLLAGDSDIKKFAADYARAYHLLLSECIPPESPWPSDIHVAFTSSDEIISALSREVRIHVSMLAIDILKHAMFRGRVPHVWSRPHNLESLIREVEQNRCVLSISAESEVFRLVTVTAVAVKRADTKLLVELGTWDADGGLKVNCKLPGTKQEGSESPLEALRRVLNSKLALCQQYIVVGSSPPELDSEFLHSATYNIKTKYLRTVFNAHYVINDDPCPFVNLLIPQRHDCPVHPDPFYLQVYGVLDGKAKVTLYAWLEESDLLCFRQNDDGSLERLKHYLHSLNFHDWIGEHSTTHRQSTTHDVVELAVLPGVPM